MTSERKVLLAIAPPLRRVVEHLLADLDVEIVGRPLCGEEMVSEARRQRPHLILVDAKLLGRGSLRCVSAAKACSPASRVVLIHPSYLERPIPGADAYVEEDAVVRRLRATVRLPGGRGGPRHPRPKR